MLTMAESSSHAMILAVMELRKNVSKLNWGQKMEIHMG